MRITPYLFFDGDCEEAFGHYAEVLGGEIEAMLPHAGTPAEKDVPSAWRSKIIHACLRVGDERLMASDVPPEQRQVPQGFCVSLHIDVPAEAERVFGVLAEGGRVAMPFQETFWARGFGMLTDRYGTPWMNNCSREPAALTAGFAQPRGRDPCATVGSGPAAPL
jgi:PhnB protein